MSWRTRAEVEKDIANRTTFGVLLDIDAIADASRNDVGTCILNSTDQNLAQKILGVDQKAWIEITENDGAINMNKLLDAATSKDQAAIRQGGRAHG